MWIKHLCIKYYAKQFRRYSNKLAKYTFLNPKYEKTRVPEGNDILAINTLLSKLSSFALNAVILDTPFVKRYYPELLGAYYESISRYSPVMVVGYNWYSSGSTDIKKQLEEKQIDTEILDSLKPVGDTAYLKDRMLFTLFPDLNEYVCFEPITEAVAKELSQINNSETALLALQYMGYQTL